MQKATIPMQNTAFGARPRWAVQRLSKVVGLVVGGGWWVGDEPVHDSAHVTYRLLAPRTEPSGAPQPIN